MDFSDVMGSSEPLLDQAEDLLKKKLKLNPKDENALWKLGDVLRQKGLLTKAVDCYKKLLILRPDHEEAEFLSAILERKSLSSYRLDGLNPTPFVRTTGFLSESEQEQIWEQVRLKKEQFEVSGAGGIKGRKDHRSSHVLYKDELQGIASWFLEKVTRLLDDLWQHLQLNPFDVREKELQLTMHQHGEFFKIHKDSGKHKEVESRRVTYVYYFHSVPKRFSGGDLLLFDTDPKENKCSVKYTRIRPLNNSIIFFPSRFYHQVTPVTCESDRMEHGRFTVNGWLHDKEVSYGD